MTKYCATCKKNKETKEMQDEAICKKCFQEAVGSFGFFIDGKPVSKEKFERIVKRGYVIPEELDEDRK